MSLKDLKSDIDFVQSLAPASVVAAANGAGVDLHDYSSAVVLIEAGAIGGTATPAFTFEVQDSADNITFAAVADAQLDGAEPVIVASNSVSRIGYKGEKRYVRVVVKTVSGTSPTLLCAAGVIRGNPHIGPL